MNEKLSITLPSELVAIINEQVESGRYASTSDVLRDALESWMREDAGFEPDIEYMQARTRQSLADPAPPVPLEEGLAQLRARLRQLPQQD